MPRTVARNQRTARAEPDLWQVPWTMDHDHNFKNLVVDYPRESIAFFAAVEAQAVDAGARILPLREEQLKERLGERFRELDVPLLVEWPDGRRAALLFVFEGSGSDTP